MLIDKLEQIKGKYEEISGKLMDPDVTSDMGEYRKLIKESSELEGIVRKYGEYRGILKDLEDTEEMLASDEVKGDEEMLMLTEAEKEDLISKRDSCETELRMMLVPKDPDADRNVILEIRSGTGGDEAALFGLDLLRMYTRYAERHRLKMEYISSNFTELGGVKEVIIGVKGKGAFSRLKYESGVHRVQRVPETESSGRIHTSAATVAVMPEAEDVEVEINPQDLKIDVYRASGHGGQGVNTTDSAVRVTHLPTGMVVTCQDERSQLKNKDRAIKILKSRLYTMMREEADREYAENRKNQVGSGDRSERIRTYNFPQGRVTDHRIGMTIYKIEEFLDGDMDEIIDALMNDEAERKLEQYGY